MPSSNVNWFSPLVRWPTLFPGQIGVPGTDSDRGLRQDSNGKVLYVDPNHVDPSDLRDGTNPDAPLATVAEALTQCRAYSGDVIAVMHNGLWTYASPGSARRNPIQESVIVTVPGVRIVGVSCGSLGVPWVPTATNATCITIRAMDVVVEGFAFWDPSYGGATAILAQWSGGATAYYGENVVIRHSYFYNMDYGIQLDYTYNAYIEDCRFEDTDTAAIFNPSAYGEPDYSVIRNNAFVHNAAAITLNSGCSEELIEGNRFINNTLAITMLNGAHNNTIHANTIQGNPAGANNFINLTGATATNLVSDNWLSCNIAQYDTTCSDATSGQWVNNHCLNGDTTAPPT